MSVKAKQRLATLVGLWPVERLMRLAVLLLAPRHRVGVGVVCLNAQGHVLLLKHVFHPHMPWGLPGGWLGRNEAPGAGALRELREETGLRATLGPTLHINRSHKTGNIDIVFLAWAQPAEIRLSHEILEWGWYEPASLPALHPSAHRAIEAARAHPTLPRTMGKPA